MVKIKRPTTIKKYYYQFEGELVKTIDGDSFIAKVYNDFYQSIEEVEFRLAHINTAEKSSKDVKELQIALKAEARFNELLKDRRFLGTSAKPYKEDLYNRWLVEIIQVDGLNVGEVLLAEKLAIRYEGVGKKDFTELIKFHFPESVVAE